MCYEINKIYCIDCYEAIKQLPDKSVDLIYTDIPYDIEDNGGGGCFGEKKRDYHSEYEKVCENTKASRVWKPTSKYIDGIKELAYGIDFSILDEFCRVCKKIYIYIWCSKKQILPLMNYFVEEKGCRFEILTWHKTNPIPTCNNKYLSDTEYCLLFREEGTYIGGNMKSKGKYFESISESEGGGFWISPINTTDKSKFAHPTIKPLEFVSNHILNSTNENDIVLDPFMGSGTTAVACKNLERNFIGLEISERWHKIACDRLNNIQANGQMTLFTE